MDSDTGGTKAASKDPNQRETTVFQERSGILSYTVSAVQRLNWLNRRRPGLCQSISQHSGHPYGDRNIFGSLAHDESFSREMFADTNDHSLSSVKRSWKKIPSNTDTFQQSQPVIWKTKTHSDEKPKRSECQELKESENHPSNDKSETNRKEHNTAFVTGIMDNQHTPSQDWETHMKKLAKEFADNLGKASMASSEGSPSEANGNRDKKNVISKDVNIKQSVRLTLGQGESSKLHRAQDVNNRYLTKTVEENKSKVSKRVRFGDVKYRYIESRPKGTVNKKSIGLNQKIDKSTGKPIISKQEDNLEKVKDKIMVDALKKNPITGAKKPYPSSEIKQRAKELKEALGKQNEKLSDVQKIITGKNVSNSKSDVVETHKAKNDKKSVILLGSFEKDKTSKVTANKEQSKAKATKTVKRVSFGGTSYRFIEQRPNTDNMNKNFALSNTIDKASKMLDLKANNGRVQRKNSKEIKKEHFLVKTAKVTDNLSGLTLQESKEKVLNYSKQKQDKKLKPEYKITEVTATMKHKVENMKHSGIKSDEVSGIKSQKRRLVQDQDGSKNNEYTKLKKPSENNKDYSNKQKNSQSAGKHVPYAKNKESSDKQTNVCSKSVATRTSCLDENKNEKPVMFETKTRELDIVHGKPQKTYKERKTNNLTKENSLISKSGVHSNTEKTSMSPLQIQVETVRESKMLKSKPVASHSQNSEKDDSETESASETDSLPFLDEFPIIEKKMIEQSVSLFYHGVSKTGMKLSSTSISETEIEIEKEPSNVNVRTNSECAYDHSKKLPQENSAKMATHEMTNVKSNDKNNVNMTSDSNSSNPKPQKALVARVNKLNRVTTESSSVIGYTKQSQKSGSLKTSYPPSAVSSGANTTNKMTSCAKVNMPSTATPSSSSSLVTGSSKDAGYSNQSQNSGLMTSGLSKTKSHASLPSFTTHQTTKSPINAVDNVPQMPKNTTVLHKVFQSSCNPVIPVASKAIASVAPPIIINHKTLDSLRNAVLSAKSRSFTDAVSTAVSKSRCSTDAMTTAVSKPRSSKDTMSIAVSKSRSSTDAMSTAVAKPRSSINAVSTAVSKPRSSIDAVSTAVSKPRSSKDTMSIAVSKSRSSTDAMSTAVAKPRSSINAVSTAVSKPRSSTDDMSTAVSKPRSSIDAMSTAVSKPSSSTDAMSTAVCTPRSSTDAMSTAISKPRSSTDAMPTAISKPKRYTDAMTTAVSKPRSSTNAMTKAVSKPRSSTDAMSTAVFKPRSSTDAMSTFVTKPRISTDAMSTAVFKPRSSTDAKTTAVFKPRSSTNAMTTAISKPRSSTDAMSTSVSKPRSSTDAMSTSVSKPRSSTDAMLTSVSKPRSSIDAVSSAISNPRSSTDAVLGSCFTQNSLPPTTTTFSQASSSKNAHSFTYYDKIRQDCDKYHQSKLQQRKVSSSDSNNLSSTKLPATISQGIQDYSFSNEALGTNSHCQSERQHAGTTKSDRLSVGESAQNNGRSANSFPRSYLPSYYQSSAAMKGQNQSVQDPYHITPQKTWYVQVPPITFPQRTQSVHAPSSVVSQQKNVNNHQLSYLPQSHNRPLDNMEASLHSSLHKPSHIERSKTPVPSMSRHSSSSQLLQNVRTRCNQMQTNFANTGHTNQQLGYPVPQNSLRNHMTLPLYRYPVNHWPYLDGSFPSYGMTNPNICQYSGTSFESLGSTCNSYGYKRCDYNQLNTYPNVHDGNQVDPFGWLRSDTTPVRAGLSQQNMPLTIPNCGRTVSNYTENHSNGSVTDQSLHGVRGGIQNQLSNGSGMQQHQFTNQSNRNGQVLMNTRANSYTDHGHNSGQGYSSNVNFSRLHGSDLPCGDGQNEKPNVPKTNHESSVLNISPTIGDLGEKALSDSELVNMLCDFLDDYSDKSLFAMINECDTEVDGHTLADKSKKTKTVERLISVDKNLDIFDTNNRSPPVLSPIQSNQLIKKPEGFDNACVGKPLEKKAYKDTADMNMTTDKRNDGISQLELMNKEVANMNKKIVNNDYYELKSSIPDERSEKSKEVNKGVADTNKTVKKHDRIYFESSDKIPDRTPEKIRGMNMSSGKKDPAQQSDNVVKNVKQGRMSEKCHGNDKTDNDMLKDTTINNTKPEIKNKHIADTNKMVNESDQPKSQSGISEVKTGNEKIEHHSNITNEIEGINNFGISLQKAVNPATSRGLVTDIQITSKDRGAEDLKFSSNETLVTYGRNKTKSQTSSAKMHAIEEAKSIEVLFKSPIVSLNVDSSSKDKDKLGPKTDETDSKVSGESRYKGKSETESNITKPKQPSSNITKQNQPSSKVPITEQGNSVQVSQSFSTVLKNDSRPKCKDKIDIETNKAVHKIPSPKSNTTVQTDSVKAKSKVLSKPECIATVESENHGAKVTCNEIPNSVKTISQAAQTESVVSCKTNHKDKVILETSNTNKFVSRKANTDETIISKDITESKVKTSIPEECNKLLSKPNTNKKTKSKSKNRHSKVDKMDSSDSEKIKPSDVKTQSQKRLVLGESKSDRAGSRSSEIDKYGNIFSSLQNCLGSPRIENKRKDACKDFKNSIASPRSKTKKQLNDRKEEGKEKPEPIIESSVIVPKRKQKVTQSDQPGKEMKVSPAKKAKVVGKNDDESTISSKFNESGKVASPVAEVKTTSATDLEKDNKNETTVELRETKKQLDSSEVTGENEKRISENKPKLVIKAKNPGLWTLQQEQRLLGAAARFLGDDFNQNIPRKRKRPTLYDSYSCADKTERYFGNMETRSRSAKAAPHNITGSQEISDRSEIHSVKKKHKGEIEITFEEELDKELQRIEIEITKKKERRGRPKKKVTNEGLECKDSESKVNQTEMVLTEDKVDEKKDTDKEKISSTVPVKHKIRKFKGKKYKGKASFRVKLTDIMVTQAAHTKTVESEATVEKEVGTKIDSTQDVLANDEIIIKSKDKKCSLTVTDKNKANSDVKKCTKRKADSNKKTPKKRKVEAEGARAKRKHGKALGHGGEIGSGEMVQESQCRVCNIMFKFGELYSHFRNYHPTACEVCYKDFHTKVSHIY